VYSATLLCSVQRASFHFFSFNVHKLGNLKRTSTCCLASSDAVRKNVKIQRWRCEEQARLTTIVEIWSVTGLLRIHRYTRTDYLWHYLAASMCLSTAVCLNFRTWLCCIGLRLHNR
jgi:hypothetical protein